jgi:hypothetical protein
MDTREEARHQVNRELERLRKAHQMVVSDPEIMQGTPVFRGTRIPIDLVVEMIADRTCSVVHESFPRRGCPSRYPWAKQKPDRLEKSNATQHTLALLARPKKRLEG